MPRSELADGSGNLAAAADRWARRGGEILVLSTDEPQIDYRQASAESLPRDDVVEGAEGHDGGAAAYWIREEPVAQSQVGTNQRNIWYA